MSAITAFINTLGYSLLHCQKCLPIILTITTEITKFTYNYMKERSENKRDKNDTTRYYY